MTYATLLDQRDEILALGEIIRGLRGIDNPNFTGFTPMESRIIWVLQNADGGVITHDAALDAMYESPAYEPAQPRFRFIVCTIRVKMRLLGHAGRIVTVPAVGYRWEGPPMVAPP